MLTHAPLAQSVERRTVNPQVVGSSPTGGAKNRQSSAEGCRFCLFTLHSILRADFWEVTGKNELRRSRMRLVHFFEKLVTGERMKFRKVHLKQAVNDSRKIISRLKRALHRLTACESLAASLYTKKSPADKRGEIGKQAKTL